ncbi:hypothetical protein QZH41_015055, partial [Actinostola sp. cb2023]
NVPQCLFILTWSTTRLQSCRKSKEFIDNGMSATLDVALDVEERKQDSEQVKELKDNMVQYVEMEKEVGQWLTALEKTKAEFNKQNNPSNDEVPDIEAIFDKQLKTLEASNKKADLFSHKKVKDFESKIWKVHHEGRPMPREGNDPMEDEDADLIMSQVTLSPIHASERTTCPITTTEMKKPVKNVKCGHSYEKEAIEKHLEIASKKRKTMKCPIAGCIQNVTKAVLEANTDLERLIMRKNRKQAKS